MCACIKEVERICVDTSSILDTPCDTARAESPCACDVHHVSRDPHHIRHACLCARASTSTNRVERYDTSRHMWWISHTVSFPNARVAHIAAGHTARMQFARAHKSSHRRARDAHSREE